MNQCERRGQAITSTRNSSPARYQVHADRISRGSHNQAKLLLSRSIRTDEFFLSSQESKTVLILELNSRQDLTAVTKLSFHTSRSLLRVLDVRRDNLWKLHLHPPVQIGLDAALAPSLAAPPRQLSLNSLVKVVEVSGEVHLEPTSLVSEDLKSAGLVDEPNEIRRGSRVIRETTLRCGE